MHTVDYKIRLCGSLIFDSLMRQTAQKLCADFPNLSMDSDTKEITIHGDLDDNDYQRYQVAMYGNSHSA